MPDRRSPFRRFSAWLTWQRVPVGLIPMRDERREVRLLLGYAALYILLSLLTGLWISRFPHPFLGATHLTSDIAYIFFFKIGGLLVLPLVFFFHAGYGVRDLLVEWQAGARRIAMVAFAFVVGVIVNSYHLKQIVAAAPNFSDGELWLRAGLGVILPLFTAGLPEEIVYRALLQTRLEKLWGRVPALLTASLLFTAWHLPTRFLLSTGVEGEALNLNSVLLGTGLPVFIVGLILGWLWDRYRSLPALAALHWGIDVLPTVSSLLKVSF